GDKPTIVYFYDGRKAHDNEKLNDVLFRTNETVGTGARGFNTLKLDITKIHREDLKAEYGKSVPKFCFYSHTGELISKTEGSVTLPLFLSALTKAFNAEYSIPLDKFVKLHRTILDRLDRVNGKKQAVTEKRTLLEESGRKDARTAAILKELDKSEKE